MVKGVPTQIRKITTINSHKNKKYFIVTKTHIKKHTNISKVRPALKLISPSSQEKTRIETIFQKAQNSLIEAPLIIQTLSSNGQANSTIQTPITLKKECRTYFQQTETKFFKNYGKTIFSFSKQEEESRIFPMNYLEKHSFSPLLRFRMVDYLHTIILNTHKELETFFLTCFNMDTFLAKTKRNINERNFFLISITSLYISSKIDSIIPFHINECIQISKMFSISPFTEKEIKETEIDIINTVNFKLVSVSSYDFIKTYFADFLTSNNENISKYSMERYISALKNISTYFSKLTLLQTNFHQYNQSYIAIACIIVAYELLTLNSKQMTQTISVYLCKWVNSLIDKVNECNKVKEVYNLLKELLKSKLKTKIAEDTELYYD